jgi:hypothetical protein
MANGKVPGPQCQSRRALQINDGTLCLQPSATPGSLTALRADSMNAIARMSKTEKLGAAIMRSRSYVAPEVADKLLELVTPEALAIIGVTVTAWAVGHAFGVSEIVDVVLIGLGVFALGTEAWTAAKDLSSFITVALNARSANDLDLAGQYFARFVTRVGVDTAIALLLRKTIGKGKPAPTKAPALRPDISLSSGGRSGPNVKFLTGPPNSVVKSTAPGRVFLTDENGRVILDIDRDRAKPVVPGVGFQRHDKRPLTAEEMDWIKKLWGK